MTGSPMEFFAEMSDDKIQLAAYLLVLLFSLSFHEYAHAWMAFRCGDDTAALMGRLTMNPIAHLDPFLSILLPIISYKAGFLMGGGKPVPVNPYRMRNPARDSMLVALAGPVSNVVLAGAFTVVLQIAFRTSVIEEFSLPYTIFQEAIRLNLFLAFFNMIPVPPLDGSRVLSYFLPRPAREVFFAMDRYGFVIIFLLLSLGLFAPFQLMFHHFYHAYSSALMPHGA